MRINDTSLETFIIQQYQKSYSEYEKSIQRIVSGERSAADDPAGLAISEKMRAEINGTNQASRNVQDATSLVQTADGAMSQMHSILQRLNTLANQAATGTYTDEQRTALDEEYQQLVEEMQDITRDTSFNGISLLNGTLGEEHGGIIIQTGAKEGQTMTMFLEGMDLSALAACDLKTQEGAGNAIGVVQAGIDTLSAQRARAGAYQNRLEYKLENLENMATNLAEAESRIRDVDIAQEMTNLVTHQLKMQVATAMLAQVLSMKRQNVAALFGIMAL
ncbi:MAG: flagellin [Candidatus Pelethousia sp.]|nr:flagellin [Candidatus Pelethousia sp.]